MTKSRKIAARIEAEALAGRLAHDYSREVFQELRMVLKERLGSSSRLEQRIRNKLIAGPT